MTEQTTNKKILDFYATPSKMTDLSKYDAIIKKLPHDVRELTYIVQGLVIHQYVAEPFYKFKPTKERIDKESHIREAAKMLDCIFEREDTPLMTERKPEDRLVGVCHDFAVLLVALLRAKGIPARSRYGFGAYFNKGFFEDHSLCEYWNEKEAKWILVDPQFDKVWQKELHIKHDVFDVPRDQFLVAGDAWMQCRKGKADAAKFGIFQGDMRGLWFVAGSLVRDVAALNKMEMLQWDVWGVMPTPNSTIKDKKRLAFFDTLASLTQDSDASFEEIKKVYADKTISIAVPKNVFNALRKHQESI